MGIEITISIVHDTRYSTGQGDYSFSNSIQYGVLQSATVSYTSGTGTVT